MSAAYIDHVGIIVASLEEAIGRLEPLLGPPDAVKSLTEVGLKVAEFRGANVTIELLEYAPGSRAELAKRTMGERLGLNHLSLRVDDLDESVSDLKARGFTLMDGFPRQGAHGRIAFFHPDAATGLLFEVCEPDA